MDVAAIWSYNLVDLYKFQSPFPIKRHIKLASIGKAVLQKRVFEKLWTMDYYGDKCDYLGIICMGL